YTKTSSNDEGTWEDSQGNEYTDEEVASLTRDRTDSGATEEDTAEGLTDLQRAQAAKASEIPVGGRVTDEDGLSYVRNDDGEWEREDGEGVVGSDEELAEYVGDQAISVDETDPNNHVFNPNVIDNRDYRPVDENGVARDRTPEESEALRVAKDAQPGDTFIDDDGDEYTKHENDKWTRAGETLEDGGYHNSEHFMRSIGPANPQPTERQEESAPSEARTSTEPRRPGAPSEEEYDL